MEQKNLLPGVSCTAPVEFGYNWSAPVPIYSFAYEGLDWITSEIVMQRANDGLLLGCIGVHRAN